LSRFIGPPLREVFCQLCEPADGVLVERAVTVFRERFSTIGLFENTPYPDVSQMLNDLSGKLYNLYVATSKPQVYAEQILKHFSLADHFVEIHGNDLAGNLDDKAVLLRDLVERRKLDPQTTIMIGDRKHDVIAAQKNGVTSLAVTYGYGSREELLAAGANYLAQTPGEVVECIVQLT
jgi:phosphoglycolate phosphatase